MIREWLRPSGNTVRFDTVTQCIEERNAEGENVVEIHAATEEDIAEYMSYYPEASQEEINARNALTSQLNDALLALRNATLDNVIAPEEFAGANPLVQVALKGYRDFPYESKEVDRLAFLVLSQVSFAYSLLLSQASVTIRALGAANLALELRVAALEAGS